MRLTQSCGPEWLEPGGGLDVCARRTVHLVSLLAPTGWITTVDEFRLVLTLDDLLLELSDCGSGEVYMLEDQVLGGPVRERLDHSDRQDSVRQRAEGVGEGVAGHTGR